MKRLLCTLATGWLLNVHAQGNSETAAPGVPDDLKRNLVLYFNFDRAEAGGVVPDKSSNGNAGQAVGAQWTPSGHRGGGFQFGPATNYIRVPNSDSLNPERVTLAAWVKTARHDQFWRRVVDKGHKLGYALTIAGEMYAPGLSGQGRLKNLKSLYEQGLITKEDYDKKVKEIIDSL